jgi:hypothetical protein
MTSPGMLAVPVAEHGSRTGGVRLSGLTVRVYRDRREHDFYNRDEQTTVALLRAHGLAPDMSIVDQWRGHSYAAMTGDLLADRSTPLPDLDLVVLAYHTPDLHVAEAAGCYLAQRCPGEPTSFAISQQGPGSAFTALRVADSMCGFGALRAGAVFVLDQTTPVCEPGTPWQQQADAAVLVEVGTEGPVELYELAETATADPVLGLGEAIARRPVDTIVVGVTLGALLTGEVLADPRLVVGPTGHSCTSAWVALAEQWPLNGPALLADYDPHAGRLHFGWLGPVEHAS